MIVDTSALVAIFLGEPDWQRLRSAIGSSRSAIPAPVLTELWLVTGGRGTDEVAGARLLVSSLVKSGVEIIGFDQHHADITVAARDLYGKGNGKGGALNFGDLIYAVARQRNEPLLCTGRDFAATDLAIHPASRLDP